MIDPSEFDKMINWAFVAATAIYAMIGYAGYLMYGNHVSDEVCNIVLHRWVALKKASQLSMDMLNTPGFNPLLNQAALWMLVLNPL
jgi:vesicular inhibitory amino acid transporter